MDLSALYLDPKQVEFLYSQYYVEGCLLGACACPEIPLPDVWLPWVIKHHNQIESISQADQITESLFGYFKSCLAHMHKGTLQLPKYAIYHPLSVASTNVHNNKGIQQNNALNEWCTGLLMAHSAREKYWQGAWDKMQSQHPKEAPKMAKDLRHCLMMFSTFAKPEKVASGVKQASMSDVKLAQNLPLIAKSLPQALLTYVDISGALAAYLPKQFETFEQKNN